MTEEARDAIMDIIKELKSPVSVDIATTSIHADIAVQLTRIADRMDDICEHGLSVNNAY